MSIESIHPTPTYANPAVTKSQKSDNQSAAFKTFQVNEKPATPANNLVAASSSILTNNTSNTNRYTGAEFDQVTAILRNYDLNDVTDNEAKELWIKLRETGIFKSNELYFPPPFPGFYNPETLERLNYDPNRKYNLLGQLHASGYAPGVWYRDNNELINAKQLFNLLNAANFAAGHQDHDSVFPGFSTPEVSEAIETAKKQYLASSSLYTSRSTKDDKEEKKTQLKPTISKPQASVPAA